MCYVVYTVEPASVSLVGIFSTHKNAFDACERQEAAGNNAWMVCGSMDKTIGHRIDLPAPTSNRTGWKFEHRAQVAHPQGEVNVLHSKLLVALEMLKELGQREEYDRLTAKFVKEEE